VAARIFWRPPKCSTMRVMTDQGNRGTRDSSR
jgi:hypothetical protein